MTDDYDVYLIILMMQKTLANATPASKRGSMAVVGLKQILD